MTGVRPEDRASIAPKSLGSRVGRTLIFLAAALVLVATLYPVDGPAGGSGGLCLICGERGLADAIVNVILFLPLGAAAALTGRSTTWALVLGVALSCSVEVAQISLIPGRDASVGDLVFNTLGAATGVALLRTAAWWLGGDRVRASRLSLVAALMTMAVVISTALLFVPDLPGGTYFVMWRPVLRHLDRYDAPVRAATLDGELLLPRQIDEPAALRRLLHLGAPIRVHAIAAAAPSRQAALLAIYDEQKREIMLLGPDRHDLVYRVRMRAASALLNQPEVRVIEGWRQIERGSDITVTARRSGRAYCVGLGTEPPCTGGFTAGMGWTLLLRMSHWAVWLHSWLNVAWLAVMGFAVGFWSRRRWESVAALAFFVAAVAVVPQWFGLLATPMAQLLGAFLGVGLGIMLARLVVGDSSRHERVAATPR